MISRRDLGVSALGLLAAVTAAPGARAQGSWPTRTVTVVAPFAAGGSTDYMARLIAQQLSAKLGQQFVVDNKAGANGALGNGAVARARPDGYTLLVSPNSTYAMNPHLYSNLPYNQERDLMPVSLLAMNGMFLCVRADSRARTLADFVSMAKAVPGRVSYGSGGIGSSNHLAPEMFAAAAGIQLQHVPYRGGGPAMQALIAGEIQMSFVDTVTALPFIRSGELRALAITTQQRLPLLPEVPTLAESGMPGFSASTDFALFVPANTPAPVVQRLSAAVAEIFQAPEFREKLQSMSIEPIGGPPDAFAAYYAAESAKWGAIIRERDIRVE